MRVAARALALAAALLLPPTPPAAAAGAPTRAEALRALAGPTDVASRRYRLGEWTKSRADCTEVLKRNPSHFGALEGSGLISLELGRPDEALSYFERALAVNPNLATSRASAEMLRRQLGRRRKDTL